MTITYPFYIHFDTNNEQLHREGEKIKYQCRKIEEEKGKEQVYVTGESGYLGSWIVTRLLQFGYSVNAIIRSHPSNFVIPTIN